MCRIKIMANVKFIVDGRELEGEEGSYLLPVLLKNGFNIPHLCCHEGVKPYGVCRLCIVELDRGDWQKVVTSCNYPIKAGMKIVTNSDRLVRERRMLAELMLARSSKTPEVIELARSLGVTETRFEPKEDNGCVMCGHCVRACEEVVGVSAICFSQRGPKREVVSPFLDSSKDCIGCGSCAYICPTNYIEMYEKGDVRGFPQWKVEFKMTRCKKCGQLIAPKKQLEYIIKKAGLPKDYYDVCINCR